MAEKIWFIQIMDPASKSGCLSYTCSGFEKFEPNILILKDVRAHGRVRKSPQNKEGDKVTVHEGNYTIENLTSLWTRKQIDIPDWWDS